MLLRTTENIQERGKAERYPYSHEAERMRRPQQEKSDKFTVNGLLVPKSRGFRPPGPTNEMKAGWFNNYDQC